jgi:hypothetical protein
VDKAVFVSMLQTQCGLPNQFARFRERQGATPLDDLGEVHSFDQLHHQEVRPIHFSRIGGSNDVRVIEFSDYFHLSLKSCLGCGIRHPVGGQLLHGQAFLEVNVVGTVDRTHTTRTNLFQKPILAQETRRFHSPAVTWSL